MHANTACGQGSPQPLNEDVVQIATLAIHRDADARAAQAVCPGKGCELRPLIAVHNVRRSKPIDGLVQRLHAEVRVQRVRDSPRQNHPGMPIHDRHQIEEPAAHGQVGDVHAPDLVWPVYPQTPQQIGVGLVPLRRPAGVGFLIDRHQSHQAHEPTDALLVHRMAFVAQVPGHLADAKERCLEELHIDQPHQRKVLLRLALNSGACCFRFDIFDLLLGEDQQTAIQSLRQCPVFGGHLSGPCGANDEFLLAATVQNLRKLAKIFPAPQQTRKA